MKAKTLAVLTAVVVSMTASIKSYAAMTDNVFTFERIAAVQGQDAFGESFTLTQDAPFSLTLTDFAFPDELDSVGVTLVSATEEIASIVFENEDDWSTNSWGFGMRSFRPGYGRGGIKNSHSWGSDFKQETVTGHLDAGTYYLSMYAEFDNDWHYYEGMQYGLYGVEMIATPLSASAMFMASGLGVLGYLRRRSGKSTAA